MARAGDDLEGSRSRRVGKSRKNYCRDAESGRQIRVIVADRERIFDSVKQCEDANFFLLFKKHVLVGLSQQCINLNPRRNVNSQHPPNHEQ